MDPHARYQPLLDTRVPVEDIVPRVDRPSAGWWYSSSSIRMEGFRVELRRATVKETAPLAGVALAAACAVVLGTAPEMSGDPSFLGLRGGGLNAVIGLLGGALYSSFGIGAIYTRALTHERGEDAARWLLAGATTLAAVAAGTVLWITSDLGALPRLGAALGSALGGAILFAVTGAVAVRIGDAVERLVLGEVEPRDRSGAMLYGAVWPAAIPVHLAATLLAGLVRVFVAMADRLYGRKD